MKKSKYSILPIVGLALTAAPANAATALILDGKVHQDAGWDNLLPTPTNPGSISVDGIFNDDTWGFGKDTVITQTAGTLDGGSKTMNFGAFNGTDGGGTWNMSGGTIIARAINMNSTTNSTLNISGGSLILNSTGIELGKGATISSSKSGSFLNISGSAVLDETNATKDRNTGGAYDIASDWTGYWTSGFYDGDTDGWEDFVVANITLDSAAVDAATFDSKFTVTDNGQRLALISEPNSTFAITEIVYALDPELGPAVTLTWPKSEATSYIAKYSRDLTGWGLDMGDGLTADLDEKPEDADHITVTFLLSDLGLEEGTDLFFRIEEE